MLSDVFRGPVLIGEYTTSCEILYGYTPIVCSTFHVMEDSVHCKIPLANIKNYTMHRISVTGCSQTFLSFTIFPLTCLSEP
jgi:hypothetical protein